MRKRLRKKKHLGEFVEWGGPVVIRRSRQEGFEAFFDDFLDQAIEGNGCYFGGGGKQDQLEGIVELGQASAEPEERLKRVAAWLEAREDVEGYEIGKMVDLWYGPFEDEEDDHEVVVDAQPGKGAARPR